MLAQGLLPKSREEPQEHGLRTPGSQGLASAWESQALGTQEGALLRDRPAKAPRGSTHAAGQAPEQVQEDGDPSPTPVGPARRVGAPVRPGTQAGRWPRAQVGGSWTLTQAGPAVRVEPEPGLALAEVRAWCVHASVLTATVVHLALIHVWTGTRAKGQPPQGPRSRHPHSGTPLRCPRSEPTLARAEWGEGRAPPSHPASPLGGKSRHLAVARTWGALGVRHNTRSSGLDKAAAADGTWLGVGGAQLLRPFETEPGAGALPQRSRSRNTQDRASCFSGTREPKRKSQ